MATAAPTWTNVAVDDGARDKAWELTVGSGLYTQLVCGALVHARVGLWKPKQATVWLAEPAAVARPLADPGFRSIRGGRSDN
jgi:hypothetical protein